MMKKIVMLLAVAAMTCFSTSAFAVHEGEGKVAGNLADITIGGSVDIRSRDFQDLDLNKNVGDGSQVDTQERVRLDVNVKAGDVQGKVTIENDWDTWGRFEAPTGAIDSHNRLVRAASRLISARHGCSSPCPARRSWSREAICSCSSARVGGSVP